MRARVLRDDLDRAADVRVHRARHAPDSRAPAARCRRSGSRAAGSGTSGSGRRPRRRRGRSRRPRSGWSRPGRCAAAATRARPSGGCATSSPAPPRPAAWTRTGRRPRGGPGGSRRHRARRRRRRSRAAASSRGVADAGELQQLGRVDRAAAEDHLARLDPLRAATAAACRELDADRARAVEAAPGDERPAADVEVRARHRRMQVRARGAQPAAAVDRAVEGGEPLLAVAVDVGRQLVARLLHRLEEGAEQRVRGRAALELAAARRRRATRRRRPGRSPCA